MKKWKWIVQSMLHNLKQLKRSVKQKGASDWFVNFIISNLIRIINIIPRLLHCNNMIKQIYSIIFIHFMACTCRHSKISLWEGRATYNQSHPKWYRGLRMQSWREKPRQFQSAIRHSRRTVWVWRHSINVHVGFFTSRYRCTCRICVLSHLTGNWGNVGFKLL